MIRLLLPLMLFSNLTILLSQEKTDPNFSSFQIDSLQEELNQKEQTWLPFFQGQNLLTGIYQLQPHAKDRQKPHDTDEVYYVIKGKAKFMAENEETNVEKGQILFVKAGVEHHFFDIEKELVLLVFFDK